MVLSIGCTVVSQLCTLPTLIPASLSLLAVPFQDPYANSISMKISSRTNPMYRVVMAVLRYPVQSIQCRRRVFTPATNVLDRDLALTWATTKSVIFSMKE